MTETPEKKRHPDDVFSVVETSVYLSRSDRFVRELIKSGELQATRTGREYRILFQWILDYLHRNKTKTPGLQSKTSAPKGFVLLNDLDMIEPRKGFYMIWNEAFMQWEMERSEPLAAGLTQMEARAQYAKPKEAVGHDTGRQ